MALVDQALAVRAVEKRLERTNDPRHRRMLETVAEHLRAEMDASVERLLSTLVPEPRYHLWQNGSDYGPKGVDEVAGYYQELVSAKRQILEFDVQRIVVDDDTVVTEGWIRAINLGSVARARGYTVDDDRASYLVTQRVVIFWPFNPEGQMLGEDGYASFDASSARLLSDEELPPVYRQLFAGAN